MIRTALCAAIISSLMTGMFAAPVMAVEVRKTPYLPSLHPPRPPILNPNSGMNRPGPTSRGCYGSTTCRNSGSYIDGNGILTYKNGEPLEVRPSTRPQMKRMRPDASHMQWCANRYNSYRTSDNSYQPLAGPRTGCNSPFQ